MKPDLEKLQMLVRGGHFEEVAKKLRKLGKLERKYAAPLANIAWRINQPALAIKILNPIIRVKDKITANRQLPPTPQEKIEYAEAIRRLGAVDEASQLLNEVDCHRYPQAALSKSFCLFNQWRYDEAVFLLQDYLSNKGLESYARSVGQINLAAALIQIGNLQEAKELLGFIREETKKSNLNLLYGNSLELLAQLFILQKNYDEALKVLVESTELLKDAGSFFGLIVQKWTAIASSLKSNRVNQQLRDVYAKTQTVKHWETLRDCDLYIAYLDHDHLRFKHLYFGTPYESFRKRILKFAGPDFHPASSHVWSLSPNPKSIFDLSSGKLEGARSGSLPIGQALHRFMILLTKDLYRPLPIMSAFGKLFPDEFMNAKTSVNRIHQIVMRCRQWIHDVGINLEIEEIDGAYRVNLGQDVGFRLFLEPLPLDSKELEWLLLQKHMGAKPFGINQAKQILSGSTSNVQRLLRWAVQHGRIEKFGQGSRTTYQLVSTREPEGAALRPAKI